MLTLFPESSLDNSILTSVLVGLLVVWALQETLGWNFTGLVVPGYLASILTIHPSTGGVVVLEALVTVGVVLLLSERVPAWWPWTRLFGRDRFFLFLLTSVAVRLALEGGGFALVRQELGLQVEEDLHSMGLVLVPLLANAVWRAGAGGAARVAIPVLITWALLAQFFVPVTNLSLSSFELTYEDLALDFVGSPRAYILLLVGAAMGSWANQRWGWDYGGIIVPGLLALCWTEPVSLAATVGEAIVIALMFQAALKLPGLRGANLTGGRPLVLAFAVGYLAKFVLGWLFGAAWPGFAVRDLYGFGYLLSSIVALRIVKHGEPFRSVVPALATSLAAFLAGSALAGALSVALPVPDRRPDVIAAVSREWPTAAWEAAAGAPEVGGIAVVDADAVVPGAYGTLRVRAGRRPLAIVATLGPLAMDGAALALADTLDARAVLLCDAEGPACERAVTQLGVRLPVVRVRPGDADVVGVAGALAAPVDLGRLGEALGFAVRAGPEDAIVVTAGTTVRLAAGRLGSAPGPLADGALTAPLAAPGPAPDAGQVRGFRELVLRPWMATLRRDVFASDALHLAAGNAARLGFGLTHTGDLSVLTGPGWRVVADAAGGPYVVVVPEAGRAPAARSAGRALARALGAALYVEDAAPDAAGWTHAAILAALEALGPEARVVTVRAVPDTADPGADVVLSAGRPVPPGGALPPLLDALAGRLGAAGFSVAVYDGGAQRLSFADRSDPAREAARANASADAHATVFVTGPAARRLGPLQAEATLASLMPSREVDLRALAAMPLAAGTEPAWRRALDELRASGGAGALLGLRRRAVAAGGGATLLVDPRVGARWLEVRPCAGCPVTLLALERGAEAAATGAPTPPLDALALGTADLRVGP